MKEGISDALFIEARRWGSLYGKLCNDQPTVIGVGGSGNEKRGTCEKYTVGHGSVAFTAPYTK